MVLDIESTSERFRAPDCIPDITITADWGDGSQWPEGEKVFDSGSLWRMFHDGEYYLFRFSSPSAGPAPYKAARFNGDFTAGDILLHRPYFVGKGAVNPLEYPLDELIITHHLSASGGVEIHGCGIIDPEGRGYLFAGQSGTGKTTLARLWEKQQGVRILSDDRIILRAVGGEIWMHGTPWHGEGRMASPEKAPLAGVFLLRRGKGNTLTPLKTAAAAARLLSCSFTPFHSRRVLEPVLAFIDRVATSVPCREFSFTPDDRAVLFLETAEGS
jgi:hypothetical protein